MQLVFNVPSKDTPGFARRLHTAATFQEQVKNGGFTPAVIESLIDFLSAYVAGENPKDQLWECSEVEFTELLKAVTGGGEASIPPQSAATLDTR